jgi:hypothetical protein
MSILTHAFIACTATTSPNLRMWAENTDITFMFQTLNAVYIKKELTILESSYSEILHVPSKV